jgi:NADPH:quinone reductase
MRAIEITQPGKPEVLQLCERPRPELKAGEVLIRVHAAGINRPDVLQRLGHYPVPPGASDLPGLEVAGEIVDGELGTAVSRRATWSARWCRAAAMRSIARRRSRSACRCRRA